LDWEYESTSEEGLAAIKDAFIDDGYFACMATLPNENWTGVIPTVMKMDMEGNQLWRTQIWDDHFHYNNEGRRILLAEDGNYVAAGWRYEILEEPNDTSGTYNDLAWISKLNSETGDILWTRYYQYLDLPFEKHRLYDMRNTSDGGFIFCGQSQDQWPDAELTEPPYQQGWLVKLDEYGCLVEGCEEFDIAVEEKEPQQVQFFKAGPNPASEVLHIYQTQQLDKNASYTITDLQGRTIQQFPAPQANTTLILNVESWASGTYVLSLTESNRLLQSEKIVVR
ncbi:T9SS type A sorting domain-containing protein, partial [Halocola ammonii]